MSEPLWLTEEQVIFVHDQQLKRHGGPAGLRDPAMLGSALGRPLNKFADGEQDLAALAAAYAYGLARNHPFVDGNKRIAFLSAVIFLRRNGVIFRPDPAEATAIILELAASTVGEEGLTRWIRDNWPKPA
jgi:death on curing protein